MHHDSMLFFSEVILWWFIMKDKDALSRFALEVSVDESSSLGFGLSKFQWKSSLLFWVSHSLSGLFLPFPHSFFFSSFKRFFDSCLKVQLSRPPTRMTSSAGGC